jgi:DNA-binding transcriptional LysR family regulator
MDLNLLSLFVTVADTSSFSEAARKLSLPRSSISRQIAELESALGVQLFHRTTRQVAISTAGAALYERVSPQLADMRRALGTLPERDELPSGLLRITVPADLGVTFMGDVLSGFAARYPGVTLDVRLSSHYVDLIAEGFDLALRISMNRLADSSLIARRLSGVALELYASPTYLARRGAIRSPEDTARHEWVSFRGTAPPPPFPKQARAPRIIGDDMLFVHRAVRAGLGIAFLPTFLAQEEVASGQLVRVLPRHTVRTGTLYLVHPKAQNVARKVSAFRDYLIDHLASHPLS